MIKFKNLPIRETATIMKGQFEQVKLLYEQNPQLAGELAISMMEQALCLDYSCTDFTIQLVLKNYEDLVEKKAVKYDAKKFAAEEAKKDALRPIADRLRLGMTQVQIMKELNMPKSTVNDKVKKIRECYPELLENPENPTDPENENSDLLDPDGSEKISGNPENMADLLESQQNPENPKNPDYVNVNDNVNDNDNVNNSRVSPSEKSLKEMTFEQLEELGAQYVLNNEGIATFSTGHQVKVKFDF